jgi:predicted enzyme related to lactoylglutathione lyase
MFASDNMEQTIAFYRTVLGFTPTLVASNYCVLERDGQTLHFQRSAGPEVMDAMRKHGECYIEVSNIKALWEHVKDFKNQYKIRDLFQQDYGMTEFHIIDPHGILVFVGQPTADIA